MTFYAEIDANNSVLRVLKVDSSLPKKGLTWLETNLGGTWIETQDPDDESSTLRGLYPGPGFTYDPEADCFFPPQPFASWVFNSETKAWEAPFPAPEEPAGYYVWDESVLDWKNEETI